LDHFVGDKGVDAVGQEIPELDADLEDLLVGYVRQLDEVHEGDLGFVDELGDGVGPYAGVGQGLVDDLEVVLQKRGQEQGELLTEALIPTLALDGDAEVLLREVDALDDLLHLFDPSHEHVQAHLVVILGCHGAAKSRDLGHALDGLETEGVLREEVSDELHDHRGLEDVAERDPAHEGAEGLQSHLDQRRLDALGRVDVHVDHEVAQVKDRGELLGHRPLQLIRLLACQ
jgi:hypothetical protein